MAGLGNKENQLICYSTLCIIFSVCFTSNAASGSFDSVLDDVTNCSETCKNTYPMHTYPEGENLVACQRGCRLLSIVEFGEDDLTDFNNTLETCKGACKEAYDDTSEDACYACCLGCKSQVPYMQQLRNKYADMEPVIHMLTPLLMMRNIYHQVLDNAHGMMMSSWSVFMQSDNGVVYVFESNPKLDVFTVEPQNQGLDLDTLIDVPSYEDGSYASNNDWLTCVSYRSGLPEWLISLILFLSSASMIWLAFASCSTSKPHRVITPKKTYKYLDSEWEDLMKKYPVCVGVAAYDESAMAEPLPIKVAIPHNNTSI